MAAAERFMCAAERVGLVLSMSRVVSGLGDGDSPGDVAVSQSARRRN